MNVKKNLESLIRGWLPRAPTSPQHNSRTTVLQNNRRLANPLPPLLEAKFQRSNGAVIGLGLGLLLIGLGGALIASSTFSEVKTFFSYTAVDPNNYLYRHLIDGIALFLTIAVAGSFLVLFGGISIKSQSFRNLTQDRDPLTRLGNFLFGSGIGITSLSFHNLFTYLLAPNDPVVNHNNFQLDLFSAFFILGASLAIAGLMVWRRKK